MARSKSGRSVSASHTPVHAQQRQVISEQRTQVYSGPLPPPEMLHRYDEIAPGLAERIVTMAEQEQGHRHDMERRQVAADIETTAILTNTEDFRIRGIFRSDKIGQWLGASVSVAAIFGAVLCVKLGAPWQVPVAMVSLPVLGMVKAIVNGRQKTPSEKSADET